MNKGHVQIGVIPIVIVSIGFVVSPVIAFYSARAATDDKIAKNTTNIAVMQNSIQNTDANVSEIKDDIKDIKKALKIP